RCWAPLARLLRRSGRARHLRSRPMPPRSRWLACLLPSSPALQNPTAASALCPPPCDAESPPPAPAALFRQGSAYKALYSCSLRESSLQSSPRSDSTRLAIPPHSAHPHPPAHNRRLFH